MNIAPKCWAIIPAAGIGERVGSHIPKQYIQIAGKTILEHAVSCFFQNSRINGIIFALHAHDEYFSQLDIKSSRIKVDTVIGGATRAQSVLNALNYLKNDLHADDFVLVHDAARPCLTNADLEKLIDVCFANKVGGILAAPMRDTIKQVDGKLISNTVDRDNIWRAFTPQMFKFEILRGAIKKAMQDDVQITDEASALEYVGLTPAVINGNVHNIKVTTQEDIFLVEMLIQSKDNS